MFDEPVFILCCWVFEYCKSKHNTSRPLCLTIYRHKHLKCLTDCRSCAVLHYHYQSSRNVLSPNECTWNDKSTHFWNTVLFSQLISTLISTNPHKCKRLRLPGENSTTRCQIANQFRQMSLQSVTIPLYYPFMISIQLDKQTSKQVNGTGFIVRIVS